MREKLDMALFLVKRVLNATRARFLRRPRRVKFEVAKTRQNIGAEGRYGGVKKGEQLWEAELVEPAKLLAREFSRQAGGQKVNGANRVEDDIVEELV